MGFQCILHRSYNCWANLNLPQVKGDVWLEIKFQCPELIQGHDYVENMSQCQTKESECWVLEAQVMRRYAVVSCCCQSLTSLTCFESQKLLSRVATHQWGQVWATTPLTAFSLQQDREGEAEVWSIWTCSSTYNARNKATIFFVYIPERNKNYRSKQ